MPPIRSSPFLQEIESIERERGSRKGAEESLAAPPEDFEEQPSAWAFLSQSPPPAPPEPGGQPMEVGGTGAGPAYRLHALQQEWVFLSQDPAFRSLTRRVDELEARIEREGEEHRRRLYEVSLSEMSAEEHQILPVWNRLVKALHQAMQVMRGEHNGL